MTSQKTILITGGAGFIGSHLCAKLLEYNYRVIAIDDLSLGSEKNINHLFLNPLFSFIKLDITNTKALSKVFREEVIHTVFHMAANSDIQKGASFLDIDFRKTFLTTFSVLECMKTYAVKSIIFSSTSAVYGEQSTRIHEDIGPLFPTSFYGAAKLCSEAYISAFVTNFNIQAWIFRFPNVVGERATHGVIYDFINRLLTNPHELIILGDGKQRKPYLYVNDLVEGMIYGWQNATDTLNYYNLGVDSTTSVDMIATIVIEEMGLKDVYLKHSGGDRGWTGDIPHFEYNLSKINNLGWKASRSSDEAVRTAVKAELLNRKIIIP